LNAYHPRLAAWFWLLGMVIIAYFGARTLTNDWLETGFLALLPASEQNPEIAGIIERHNQHINRKIIWLSGGATSSQAIDQARKLKHLLEQSKLFEQVVLEMPKQQYIRRYQQLFPYRYQLLDEQTRRMLIENPKAFFKQNLETIYSPVGQMQAADLEHDPLLLFSRYFNGQNPASLNLEQGIVVLQDRQHFWALLISDLRNNNLQLDKLEDLRTLVDTATAHLNGKLLVTGMPLFTAAGAQSAQQEISTVGVGSSAGIVLLMLLTFRSLRPLVLSFLAIGSGLFAALVISILFFGKIHIITLVFGASLIGVADDYALHFFCDSFGSKNWHPRRGLKYILPGLVIGLLTSILSYAGLGFSPFPALQEVALFSGTGLLAAWLTVVLLFPLLLTGFQADHEPVLFKLTTYWQQHWPAWLLKNRRVLMVLSAVFIVGGIWQLTPRDDVRLLQPASDELMRSADKIRQLLPMGQKNSSQENQFFLVSGKDEAGWRHNEQRLLKQLHVLQQQQALKYYQGLSDFWPEPERQRENYRLLKHGLYEPGLVKQYMTDLGFSDVSVNAELKQFGDAETKSISLTEWLETADESKRQLWLGCRADRCLSMVSLTGIGDLAKLSALQNLPGVTWVDHVDQLSALFARCRVRASALLSAAYSVVFIALGFRFGWRNALKITAIPVFSALAALAMMGWFDQLFSLFNLFALLLVLGIGVDDAIFFFIAGSHAGAVQGDVEDADDKRASTSLAVTLSALTTLLAFGLLAVSSTEIVHAFGFTVAVGILTAFICSPLVGHVQGRVVDSEKNALKFLK